MANKLAHCECYNCSNEFKFTIKSSMTKVICSKCNNAMSLGEVLSTMLMQETFHMNNAQAKIVVDRFVGEYPQILEFFKIDYLYQI